MAMPETISPYHIHSEIGRGGMATVYLAHDPSSGKKVALKVLPREFLHDPKFYARFQREARTIASLMPTALLLPIDRADGLHKGL
jgi:serine/threonine protein kinase